MIRDRLMREAESNVAIKVTESADKDSFEVAGRGELQLGVLIETMRREGFELGISRPRVLFREDENGKRDRAVRDRRHRRRRRIFGHRRREDGAPQGRDDRHAPDRAAARPASPSRAPSRGLIGYHGEFLSDTRGTGIMNRLFEKYGPHKGAIEGRKNGVLISNGAGEAVDYALGPLEERGILFVAHRRGALRRHDRSARMPRPTTSKSIR